MDTIDDTTMPTRTTIGWRRPGERLPIPVATPFAVGRSVDAQASRWLPYVDHDVLAVATRTDWWSRWLEIATAEPARLARPGDEAGGALLLGGRPVQVRWTVTRRRRDIVTIEASREQAILATLIISCSQWYDGSMTELQLTAAMGSSRRLRRTLGRALADLGATVDRVQAPGAVSTLATRAGDTRHPRVPLVQPR